MDLIFFEKIFSHEVLQMFADPSKRFTIAYRIRKSFAFENLFTKPFIWKRTIFVKKDLCNDPTVVAKPVWCDFDWILRMFQCIIEKSPSIRNVDGIKECKFVLIARMKKLTYFIKKETFHCIWSFEKLFLSNSSSCRIQTYRPVACSSEKVISSNKICVILVSKQTIKLITGKLIN